MILAGLLTCSMFLAVFSPQTALVSMFGESLQEPLAQVIVRSWGFLIGLVGILLLIGAYQPLYRNLSLIVASVSKLVFILILILYGSQYIEKAMFTIILDSLLAIIFLLFIARHKSVI